MSIYRVRHLFSAGVRKGGYTPSITPLITYLLEYPRDGSLDGFWAEMKAVSRLPFFDVCPGRDEYLASTSVPPVDGGKGGPSPRRGEEVC